MNDDARLERLFADGLLDLAPPRAPGRLTTTITAETARTRPRPRWLAIIKEPPMRLSSLLAVGSPTARVAAILAATLLIAAALTGAGIAGARLLAADGTIVVDQSGGGDFSTIAEAVSVAEDGDTVLVRPGTYVEAVVIDRDITLRGEERDLVVIQAPNDGPVEILFEDDDPEFDPYAVLLRDSNASLRDLTFRGQRSEVFVSGGSPILEGLLFDSTGTAFRGSGGAAGSSIVIARGSSAQVRANELIGGGPIGVFAGSQPLIEGNTLSGGPHIWGVEVGDGAIYRGNTIEEPFMWAFGLIDDDSPTVEGNTIIRPGRSGIEIWNGQPTVRGNTIEGAPTGINVSLGTSGGSPLVEGNTISGSTGFAISVTVGGADEEGQPTISGNTLAGNEAGIAWMSGGGTVEGNEVSDGSAGIVISGGAPTVIDNVVSGLTARGLAIGRNASPTLSGNSSCGNGENLYVAEGAAPTIDDTNEICEDAAAG